ncbi:MAG: winged helix-turn-helix transcriptional regulator [Candidatus Heimdallarchaeota archaeon]|nr:MAG: winged helix-turn-helix transcriptional regulator [Candidatus Heimdallarchaeota archaeon]
MIFSKKSQLKLIYFFLATMLFLHSFQGSQSWNHEKNENKVYCIPYSALDTFFIDFVGQTNSGTTTSTVISLEIIFNQISKTTSYSLTLLDWQLLSTIQIKYGTSPFLTYGEIFGLGVTKYSVLLLVGTIYLEKLKYQDEKKSLSRNKNRLIIKAKITQNPGINLREIQRSTNLAMGVIQYHIRSLESGEYEVESLRLGRCKHFFLSSARFSMEQKLWFSLSRNKNIKNILEILILSDGDCSQKDLSFFTGNSKSLISYYIKTLRLNGVIEVENNQLKISESFIEVNRQVLLEKL